MTQKTTDGSLYLSEAAGIDWFYWFCNRFVLIRLDRMFIYVSLSTWGEVDVHSRQSVRPIRQLLVCLDTFLLIVYLRSFESNIIHTNAFSGYNLQVQRLCYEFIKFILSSWKKCVYGHKMFALEFFFYIK